MKLVEFAKLNQSVDFAANSKELSVTGLHLAIIINPRE